MAFFIHFWLQTEICLYLSFQNTFFKAQHFLEVAIVSSISKFESRSNSIKAFCSETNHNIVCFFQSNGYNLCKISVRHVSSVEKSAKTASYQFYLRLLTTSSRRVVSSEG
jgi:hypothetical protein